MPDGPRTPPPARLRPLRAADAPAVLAAFTASPDMARQGAVRDADSATVHVERLLADGRRAIAVVDGTDRLLGLVHVDVDRADRTGWVSYWLHREARGRGLAARATATVAGLALRPEDEGGWGLERLELGHRANNPASGAVARAAGFVQEGTEREKFLVDGVRIDVLGYGRLRSDPDPGTPHLPWEGPGGDG